MLTPMQSQFASQVNEHASATVEATDRYHATVSCNEEWIEYRVAGAGAATRWHRLTTQPRPEVENFEITLTPPAYTSSVANRADLSLWKHPSTRW